MAMLQVLEECNLWKDFPNGLRVLVVDKDSRTLSDIQAKLEECKYIVATFERGEDALMALEDPKNSFHITLVEAAIGVGLDGSRILDATIKNNIPTIMMSDTENKEAILQAFALGAVEFLLKPLSDEKLKNVWQHAVRKALSLGVKAVRPESLKLLNTTIESPVNSPSVSDSDQNDILTNDKEDADLTIEGYPNLDGHVITGCEKISAPSTPQQLILKPREENAQVSSGSETQSNQATEMVSAEFSGSSNSSVDEASKEMEGFTTELRTSQDSANGDALCTALDFDCCDKMELDSVNFDDFCLGDGDLLSDIDIDPQMFADFSLEENGELDLYNLGNCELLQKDLAEEEALLLAEVSKAEKEQINANIPDITNSDLYKSCDYNRKEEVLSDNKIYSRSESVKIASKNAQAKRKVKVDWTPDLHRRFVQAVEQLGVDKAVPSRILELMGVNCLTRHNIASHLQKYRSHRKHLLAREVEAASWSQRRQLYATTAGTRSRRELTPWVSNGGSSLIHPRPTIAYSPMQPGPPFKPLHVWGHPTLDHSMVHMWQKPSLPAAPVVWPAGDGSFWQHQPTVCTDTWAHNTPAPGTPCYPQPLVRLPMAPVTGIPHFNPPVFNGDHSSPEDSDSAIHPLNIDVPAQLKPATLHPAKETVDAAIDEVLSNPWAPLPIGLKPPSLESVMTELQKQGISVVPLASTCLAR